MMDIKEIRGDWVVIPPKPRPPVTVEQAIKKAQEG